ncbi:killer cell lectin-like receptor subfamily B member 1B allele C [Pituophis catenifer annectens]|uniref:killer cell lectin-like receptor subfamily B member 1B allele C n=1 Tax=Pituophis catenifer annectens TaxID=94852 RepID=UPI0039933189
MIAQDAEYGNLNDTAIILEAEKVSRQLLPWAEKIKEIQAEIAELHYKLNHDWTAYKNHLYLLSYQSFNFYDTRKLCKTFKADILDIQDDAEEAYIEEITQEKHGDYWIGLSYGGGRWKWSINDAPPFRA